MTRGAATTLGIALALVACVSGGPADLSGPVLRPAAGAPERFEPEPPSLRIQPGDTLAGGGCRSPLVDPRDGFTIRMVRSEAVVADYAVEMGRYGVEDGELLRVECNTGRVMGVVRR